ncbi:VanZ family protein [Microbacterium sp.]|uniref:VanZ family protein n=1 Tax=Microbacterium sp. TaxID=51671 RepID=UPI00333F6561
MPRRPVAIALILGIPFLAGLLVLTIAPQAVQRHLPIFLDLALSFSRHRLGWTWLDFTTLEVAANVLVFVPVGVIAAVLLPVRRQGYALLIGPALSAMIETVQLVALPQRAATLSDLIANSLGATLGVAAVLLVRRLRRERTAGPSRLEA